MTIKKTIIFGGAFNPPTVAHEAILKACVEYAQKLDAEVWIVPSGNRHDKQIPVEREVRLKYLDAMIQDIKVEYAGTPIEIITTELDRPIAIETFDTFQRLTAEHPNRSYIWVYGADSIETMSDWGNGQWLLDNLEMLIFERQGSIVHPRAKKVSMLDVKIPVISSTAVRQRLSAGKSIDGMVGERVGHLLNKSK